MSPPTSFLARSIHTWAPDRIYRVELSDRAMYFLRIGGQFDLDRGRPSGVPGQGAAVMILAAGETLFRNHKKEEQIARDPNQDPEAVLGIHPHNFKLTPADIQNASLLPKKWLLSFVRPHHGRMVLQLTNGDRWEFHFERPEDLQTALASLSGLLGDKLTTQVAWDAARQAFAACDS